MQKYRSYDITSINQIRQLSSLPSSASDAIRIVGRVLPFKVNDYVIEELIDWDNVPADPIFRLTFPSEEMLLPNHFSVIRQALNAGSSAGQIETLIQEIHLQLNPHSDGQLEHNVPLLKDGTPLAGLQHKYKETVLFFPSKGQTCHAYCTFCFRWPQFVGNTKWKFSAKETTSLILYLKEHPEVSDVLITGGDPLIMSTTTLDNYIAPLLAAKLPNLTTIRFGSKSLSYWPYRFLDPQEGDSILRLFEKVVNSGLHLAFMAHFNHPRELSTTAVQKAIARIRSTGAEIRTQGPILRGINDSPITWSTLWREQVRLGCIPYYMFNPRDTGAQHYFALPLHQTYQIYRDAIKDVAGIARTAVGPVMSALPGKVQVLGVIKVSNEECLLLQFVQGRNQEWARKPFLARFNSEAVWLDQLVPYGGTHFFFEEELEAILRKSDKNNGRVNSSNISSIIPKTRDNLLTSHEYW